MPQLATGLKRSLGRATLCAAVAAWASVAGAELPVTLSIDSGTVAAAGQTAALCVSMDTGGEAVAGTENEIHWDHSCIRALGESCRANPAHGKTLYTRINDGLPESFLKTIVISLQDNDPIADGELYCCNFIVDLEQPGECCEVWIEKPLVSSPDAMALETVAGEPGALCLDPDAPPRSPIVPDTRTPTWTPSPVVAFETPTPTATFVDEAAFTQTPEQPFRTATRFSTPGIFPLGGGDEDDGCQVARNDAGSLGVLLLLLPVPLWLRRRAGARRSA